MLSRAWGFTIHAPKDRTLPVHTVRGFTILKSHQKKLDHTRSK